MSNTYKILFAIGEVKEGLFGSKPEVDNTLLPCLIEACFGSEYITTELNSPSMVSCSVTTGKSLSETAEIVTKKLSQAYPKISLIRFYEKDEDIQYKLGESSTINFILSPAEENVAQAKKPESVEEIDQEEAEEIIDDINQLIGWDSFKEFANESLALATQMHKRSTIDSFKSLNYLFSINDGCGLTKGINLLTLLCVYLGIFDKKYYFEFTLSDETKGEKINIKDLLDILYNKENYGKLVCLDISEYMEKNKQTDLKELLLEISHVANLFNFVFRVPYIEPQELKRVEGILSDILFIKTFTIPPYTDEEIRRYVERALNSNDFTMDESAWDIFSARIREEKSDGRFYGLRTVQKVVDETILLKHRSDIQGKETPQDDIIRPEDIKALSATYGTAEKDAFDELNEMIGMEEISKRIKEIVAQVEISAQNEKLERPCMHMRFVGAPGTGKTTVARIIGRIFAEHNLLSNGYFFEYSARDLCGEYIGQTAPKAAAICRDAYGSVLFIDEAYDLYRGGVGSENDYGREALTTLISEMENHRDNLVVIMAGYRNEMDKLMQGNTGLRSRMPYVIEFPSYTQQQLSQIFMLMAEKHFNCQKDLKPAVEAYFNNIPSSYINSEEFANARFVRNLFERTWSKAAMRVQLNGLKEISLGKEDFLAASAEKEFNEKLTAGRNRVGF